MKASNNMHLHQNVFCKCSDYFVVQDIVERLDGGWGKRVRERERQRQSVKEGGKVPAYSSQIVAAVHRAARQLPSHLMASPGRAPHKKR